MHKEETGWQMFGDLLFSAGIIWIAIQAPNIKFALIIGVVGGILMIFGNFWNKLFKGGLKNETAKD